MPKELTGIAPVLITPFDEKGGLDEESLRREVEHCIGQGAHGLAILGVVSEFYKLSPQERRRVAEVAVEAARGRRPVIVGVADINGRAAGEYAQHAAKCGADAVFSLPPIYGAATPATIKDYFRTIARATDIPITLMDIGTIPAPLMVEMGKEMEHVRYVKEESDPPGHKISELVRLSEGRLTVFGAAGGRTLLDDLARGAVGTWPGAVFIREMVEVYEAWMAGDKGEARRRFNRLLPMISFRAQFSVPVTKEILMRAGVIKSAYIREPVGYSLDDQDRRELVAVAESCGLSI